MSMLTSCPVLVAFLSCSSSPPRVTPAILAASAMQHFHTLRARYDTQVRLSNRSARTATKANAQTRTTNGADSSSQRSRASSVAASSVNEEAEESDDDDEAVDDEDEDE
jgi:hypothetical protein